MVCFDALPKDNIEYLVEALAYEQPSEASFS